jgi:hypothetical protein
MIEMSDFPILWNIPKIYSYKSAFTAQCVKSDYSKRQINFATDLKVYSYRSTFLRVVPAGSVGSVIRIAWLGAVAVRYGFAPTRGNIIQNRLYSCQGYVLDKRFENVISKRFCREYYNFGFKR